MTIINIIAGAIYTKGFPIKEKLQIYGMALVFLVILYNSPSGLVVYWTMNNVFSLVKNIFYKLRNPLKVFWIMMSIIMTAASVVVLTKISLFKSSPILLLTILTVFAPALIKGINYILNNFLGDFTSDKKKRNSIFIISSLGLAILTGIVIPSFLMTAATAGDFAYIDNYTSPLYFIYNCALQSFGLFFLWPLAIYFLFPKKIQTCLSFSFLCFLIISILNTFCFQGDYGNVSSDLIFTEHKSFKPSLISFILNLGLMIAIICGLLYLQKKHFYKATNALASIVLITMAAISIVNNIKIQTDFKKIEKPNPQLSDIKPIINFSKTSRNVLVFMLDRAAGYLIEDAFNECPEMLDQYTGFTFYPNTVSFGSWTIQGAPGLYGGYEYTPWAMNHRRKIPMQEKHNEALSMLSFIFEKNNFESYVVDPPYPNYDTEPVFQFFEGHDHVHPAEARGKYSDIWYKQNNYSKMPIKSMRIKRDLIWFSIFKIVPPVVRIAVRYNDWWSSPTAMESNADFIDRYSVLDFLPELTATTSEKSCFVFIDNEATHDTAFCQAPEFVPVEGNIDFSKVKNDLWRHDRGYHGLVASLKRIGEWIDFLKANNVYDNTRIIIVADHGSGQTSPKFVNRNPALKRNPEWFNPMLMIKDFSETATLKIDNTFMTQADTPALATKDVIKNPVNPFTKKAIKELNYEGKQRNTIISMSKANAVRSTENNGLKIQDDDWFTVKENIFDGNNWAKLTVENEKIIN